MLPGWEGVMRFGILYKVLLFGLALGLGVGQAAAERRPVMTTTGKTTQPIGHYEFCKSHLAECHQTSRVRHRVRLTPQRWNELITINTTINRTLRPATDRAMFGRDEVWSYPERRGDCEDYALLKRRELMRAGWPAGALLMTVVRRSNHEGHAVLTVLTDRGDMVLDNLQQRVLLWSDTRYQYVKRQSEFDSGQWMAINDGGAVSVGSLGR